LGRICKYKNTFWYFPENANQSDSVSGNILNVKQKQIERLAVATKNLQMIFIYRLFID
jgi:hypothetical protein